MLARDEIPHLVKCYIGLLMNRCVKQTHERFKIFRKPLFIIPNLR